MINNTPDDKEISINENINDLKQKITKLSKNLKQSISIYHTSHIKEVNKKLSEKQKETENKTIVEIIDIYEQLLVIQNSLKKQNLSNIFINRELTKIEYIRVIWFSFGRLFFKKPGKLKIVDELFQKPDEFYTLLQSIDFIIENIKDYLIKNDICEISNCGEMYDVQTMKAVGFTTKNDVEENLVVEIVKQGYIRHNNILRLAEVKINRRTDG